MLTHESVQRRAPALVIAANKSDVRGAASPEMVRATLETELQRVRLARTTMQDISGRSSKAKGRYPNPNPSPSPSPSPSPNPRPSPNPDPNQVRCGFGRCSLRCAGGGVRR